MARRAAYTKIERKNFENPAHVKGMGDKAFRGFQCLNKECTNFIFCPEDELSPDFSDFSVECSECGFVHTAGETTTLYDYKLWDKRTGKPIESGQFEILHNDYVSKSEQFKYCVVCGTLKPFSRFDRHSARKTGRQSECNLCKEVYNSIKNQTRLVEHHRKSSQHRRLYTQFESQKFDIDAIYKRFDNKCFKCGIDLSADVGSKLKKLGNLDHTLPVFYLWPLTTDNADSPMPHS